MFFDLSNCVAWHRADRGVRCDSSGRVEQWDDLSGNGNHLTQASAEMRPVFDSAPSAAVRFDGLATILNWAISLPAGSVAFASAVGTSPPALVEVSGSRVGCVGGQFYAGAVQEIVVCSSPLDVAALARLIRHLQGQGDGMLNFGRFYAPGRTQPGSFGVFVAMR